MTRCRLFVPPFSLIVTMTIALAPSIQAQEQKDENVWVFRSGDHKKEKINVTDGHAGHLVIKSSDDRGTQENFVVRWQEKDGDKAKSKSAKQGVWHLKTGDEESQPVVIVLQDDGDQSEKKVFRLRANELKRDGAHPSGHYRLIFVDQKGNVSSAGAGGFFSFEANDSHSKSEHSDHSHDQDRHADEDEHHNQDGQHGDDDHTRDHEHAHDHDHGQVHELREVIVMDEHHRLDRGHDHQADALHRMIHRELAKHGIHFDQDNVKVEVDKSDAGRIKVRLQAEQPGKTDRIRQRIRLHLTDDHIEHAELHTQGDHGHEDKHAHSDRRANAGHDGEVRRVETRTERRRVAGQPDRDFAGPPQGSPSDRAMPPVRRPDLRRGTAPALNPIDARLRRIEQQLNSLERKIDRMIRSRGPARMPSPPRPPRRPERPDQ